MTLHATWKNGIVVDGEYLEDEHACVIAPLELVEDVSLASFRDALARVEPADQRGAVFSDVPRARFVAQAADVIEGVRLDVEGRRLVLIVVTYAWWWAEDGWEEQLRSVLDPLLRRFRLELLDFVLDDWSPGEHVAARINVPVRNKTVGDVVRIGRTARALLNAVRGGRITSELAVDLVAGGHGECLVGHRETEWLEAKAAPYRLDEPREKVELAKDVAALANASGGLLVIGAQTRRHDGSDQIHRIGAFPVTMVSERRYRGVLNERVVPALEGLRLIVADHGKGRGIAAVVVPPQREALKPFIVRGAVVDGRLRRQHLSVPFRDGEDIRYEDAGVLQGQLAAGRAAIREERASAEVREEIARLQRETNRSLSRLADPAPPTLVAGEGSGNGAFRIKPDGYFFAWLLNAGGEAAEIADARLWLGAGNAEAQFPDGNRLASGEQKALMFVGLREFASVSDLERSHGRLVVEYRPVRGGDHAVLDLSLQPSRDRARTWDPVPPVSP